MGIDRSALDFKTKIVLKSLMILHHDRLSKVHLYPKPISVYHYFTFAIYFAIFNSRIKSIWHVDCAKCDWVFVSRMNSKIQFLSFYILCRATHPRDDHGCHVESIFECTSIVKICKSYWNWKYFLNLSLGHIITA